MKQTVWLCKVVHPRFENVALLYSKIDTSPSRLSS